MERSKSARSRGMSRPYTYAVRNTAKNKYIKFYEIFKRQKYLMIYEKWGNMKFKYRNREFWCRGYYVDTAGKDAKKIQEYIENQLKQDEMGEQLIMDTDPFTGGK